jgi:hypothetical protein
MRSPKISLKEGSCVCPNKKLIQTIRQKDGGQARQKDSGQARQKDGGQALQIRHDDGGRRTGITVKRDANAKIGGNKYAQ